MASGSGGSDTEGRIRVALTDAPLDDPALAEVYVTFTGVRIGDEALPNLSERRTVDISNYTEGQTIQYGSDQSVEAGVYAGLTVALDLGSDAGGVAPGAYVTDSLGRKTSLAYGQETVELRVNDPFEVVEGQLTELVLDFDLRQAVLREGEAGYTFGGDMNLTSSLRLIDKTEAGSIEGTVDEHSLFRDNGTRIVFAFPRGSFEAAAAFEGDFSAAVTSARVDATGRFRLSYLPSGGYDLIVVDYADEDGDGRIELIGARVSDATVGADVRAVSVTAGAQARIEISLGGILE